MDFDFNIKNYKLNELEDIFELPKGYSTNLLINRENKLKQSIISNSSVKNNKDKILSFVTDAKNKIMEQLSNNTNQVLDIQNTIQKNYENSFNTSSTLQQSNIINEGSSVIIDNPPTIPYINTKTGGFYPGTLNPLSMSILNKNLNIDTRFRENYFSTQSTNFHLDLPIKYSKVVSMQLTALELPSTIYSVSKIFGNNYFGININNSNFQIIFIPDGDYSNNTLQDYLNFKIY